ncbi:hypothetical protein UF72_1123 [Staphylococcus equorum subsp. equorum]|nr:hypothetical protein UF72_1123 [Staphylococcus equorum subsp. equorum]
MINPPYCNSFPICLICFPIEHSFIQKWCACVFPSVFLI